MTLNRILLVRHVVKRMTDLVNLQILARRERERTIFMKNDITSKSLELKNVRSGELANGVLGEIIKKSKEKRIEGCTCQPLTDTSEGALKATSGQP